MQKYLIVFLYVLATVVLIEAKPWCNIHGCSDSNYNGDNRYGNNDGYHENRDTLNEHSEEGYEDDEYQGDNGDRGDDEYRGVDGYRSDKKYLDGGVYSNDGEYRDDDIYPGANSYSDDSEYRNDDKYRGDDVYPGEDGYREDSEYRSDDEYRDDDRYPDSNGYHSEDKYGDEGNGNDIVHSDQSQSRKNRRRSKPGIGKYGRRGSSRQNRYDFNENRIRGYGFREQTGYRVRGYDVGVQTGYGVRVYGSDGYIIRPYNVNRYSSGRRGVDEYVKDRGGRGVNKISGGRDGGERNGELSGSEPGRGGRSSNERSSGGRGERGYSDGRSSSYSNNNDSGNDENYVFMPHECHDCTIESYGNGVGQTNTFNLHK